jgi:peptidyl-prolyl cis-trans isomerase C
MNTTQTSSHGCGGGGTCGCGSKAAGAAQQSSAHAYPSIDTPAASDAAAFTQAAVPETVAAINGITLHAPGQRPDEESLRELAYTELLRQQAVLAGLLPRKAVLEAPELDETERAVLESMVDAAVQVPAPTFDECQRYFDARKNQYVVGQAVHLRHILFAVTPGVNVQALSVHADKALISLLGKNVPVDLFGKLAAELSNCPTSTQGGDLGWVGPQDCAPELATTLFFQSEVPVGLGVQPRLIHTRFGFHIIDVLERRDGKTLAFDEVRERVAAQLAMQSRAKALHQYMSLLVGQALVEGIELDAADSPLVQ